MSRVVLVLDSITSNEDLSYLLGGKSKISRIGQETGKVKPQGVSALAVKGAPKGYEGHRLVHTVDNKIVGAIQIMKTPTSNHTVANAYVHPYFRRQGIATRLNDEGKRLFGKLDYSTDLSDEGRSFVGSLKPKKASS